MKEFLKSLLSDVDNQASSKRMLLLYIGIPIWTFVHYKVFTTLAMISERSSLIMYDFFIICALAGIVLSEKFTNRKPE